MMEQRIPFTTWEETDVFSRRATCRGSRAVRRVKNAYRRRLRREHRVELRSLLQGTGS